MRPDYCSVCRRHTIEIFDYFNYPQHYADLALASFEHRPIPCLDTRDIYTMRCRSCGKEYAIQWEDGMPKPVLYPDNRPIRHFIQSYIEME